MFLPQILAAFILSLIDAALSFQVISVASTTTGSNQASYVFYLFNPTTIVAAGFVINTVATYAILAAILAYSLYIHVYLRYKVVDLDGIGALELSSSTNITKTIVHDALTSGIQDGVQVVVEPVVKL